MYVCVYIYIYTHTYICIGLRLGETALTQAEVRVRL